MCSIERVLREVPTLSNLLQTDDARAILLRDDQPKRSRPQASKVTVLGQVLRQPEPGQTRYPFDVETDFKSIVVRQKTGSHFDVQVKVRSSGKLASLTSQMDPDQPEL